MIKDFLKSRSSRIPKYSYSRLLLSIGAIFAMLATIIGALVVILGIRHSEWDGKSRFTTVTTDPAVLISYNPKDNQLTTIPLAGVKVKLIGGYGEYATDKIYAFDRQEGRGGFVFVKSLENFLGVPIMSYISIGNSLNEQENVGGTLPLLVKMATGKLTSGMGWWDKLRWVWLVGGITPSDTKRVDLANLGVVRAETEADGHVSLTLDQGRWDRWVQGNLFENIIEGEHISVAVVNATDHTGLGNQTARVIENVGADVVRVRSESGAIEECTVGGKIELVDSQTVKFIKKVFGCGWKELDTGSERADIVVLIGEDYWRFLNGK
jgi:hypothetical protein